ncbi:MAG TPA: exonuclease domain-containing protein [Miltoncostaeaceae bacterium]|nr:exonuclease domain-containing protein [Miltoncostaeaceae bacterium]
MKDLLQLELPLPQPQPGSRRQATLADRLCDLLARRGRPLEVGHVVAQVLRMRRCPERLQRRLVAEIVEGDQRLAWRGRDLVGLAPAGWTATPVGEATFCVIDIETTGGAPGRSRITEIGAVRMRGGEVLERFETLVDPGRPVPAAITALTGIDDAMLAGSPKVEEALEAFVAFAGEDIMVAHNAPFDLRFLNYERHRCFGRYFTQPWLDTLVLARRLLRRRLERFDLGTLAGWADAPVRPIHRALPDAEAAAAVLEVLLGMLVERGHGTLQRAVALGQGGGARHAHKLALAEDLPQAPGVYLMRDGEGEVLYVGKAANLRRRVRAYFGPQGRHGRLIGRALDEVERIEHRVTASEFEALLAEASLLRELRPPCNTRGTGAGRRRQLRLSVGDPFPRLTVAAQTQDDGGAYFGPVRTERVARLAVEALARLFPIRHCHPRCAAGTQERLVGRFEECHGPCGLAPGTYAGEVADLAEMLGGPLDRALAVLGDRAERLALAGGLTTEEARADLELVLAQVVALDRARAAARAGGVIVEPGPAQGGAVCFFVWGGRVIERRELTTRSWRRAAAALTALAAAQREGPRPLEPELLEDALIVHERLRSRGAAVALAPGFDHAEALAAVRAAIRRAAVAAGPPLRDAVGDVRPAA